MSVLKDLFYFVYLLCLKDYLYGCHKNISVIDGKVNYSYTILPLSYYSLFFSSRRRHTRYWRDWSSDVCSSDLGDGKAERPVARAEVVEALHRQLPARQPVDAAAEERGRRPHDLALAAVEAQAAARDRKSVV